MRSVHQRSHGGHFKAHSSFKKEHPFERIQATDFQKGAENPQVTLNLNLIGRKFRHILPPKTLIYWDNPTLLCQENNLIGKYSNWLGTLPMRFEPHDSKQDWEHQERIRKSMAKAATHIMPKRLQAPHHGIKIEEDNFMSINPAETDHDARMHQIRNLLSENWFDDKFIEEAHQHTLFEVVQDNNNDDSEAECEDNEVAQIMKRRNDDQQYSDSDNVDHGENVGQDMNANSNWNEFDDELDYGTAENLALENPMLSSRSSSRSSFPRQTPQSPDQHNTGFGTNILAPPVRIGPRALKRQKDAESETFSGIESDKSRNTSEDNNGNNYTRDIPGNFDEIRKHGRDFYNGETENRNNLHSRNENYNSDDHDSPHEFNHGSNHGSVQGSIHGSLQSGQGSNRRSIQESIQGSNYNAESESNPESDRYTDDDVQNRTLTPQTPLETPQSPNDKQIYPIAVHTGPSLKRKISPSPIKSLVGENPQYVFLPFGRLKRTNKHLLVPSTAPSACTTPPSGSSPMNLQINGNFAQKTQTLASKSRSTNSKLSAHSIQNQNNTNLSTQTKQHNSTTNSSKAQKIPNISSTSSSSNSSKHPTASSLKRSPKRSASPTSKLAQNSKTKLQRIDQSTVNTDSVKSSNTIPRDQKLPKHLETKLPSDPKKVKNEVLPNQKYVKKLKPKTGQKPAQPPLSSHKPSGSPIQISKADTTSDITSKRAINDSRNLTKPEYYPEQKRLKLTPASELLAKAFEKYALNGTPDDLVNETEEKWLESVEKFQENLEDGVSTDNLGAIFKFLLNKFEALTVWFLATVTKPGFNYRNSFSQFVERLRQIDRPLTLNANVKQVLKQSSKNESIKLHDKNRFLVLLARHFLQTLYRINSILMYNLYQYDHHFSLSKHELDDYLLEIRDHVFKDRTVTSKLMKEIDKESKKLKEPSTSSSGSSRHSRRSETDPAGAGLHPDGDSSDISNSNKNKLHKEMLNYFVKTQYLVRAEMLWQKSDSIMEDCYKQQHGENNNNTDDNLAVNSSTNTLAEKFKRKLKLQIANSNFKESASKSLQSLETRLRASSDHQGFKFHSSLAEMVSIMHSKQELYHEIFYTWKSLE